MGSDRGLSRVDALIVKKVVRRAELLKGVAGELLFRLPQGM
jgi:hypothetical protein